MTEKDAGETPAGLLRQIIQQLRGEPVLLFGLGSVLVLTLLVGTAIGATASDQVTQIIIVSAAILLIAALAAQTVIVVRRRPRTYAAARAKANRIAAEQGADVALVARDVDRAEATAEATGDIVAKKGSRVGVVESPGEKPGAKR